jgi:cyclopropane-fatty-acyl-phospholipid synthase
MGHALLRSDVFDNEQSPAHSGRRGWLEKRITDLFAQAAVQIGGSRAADIRVLDERFYRRLTTDGAIGLGDAYVDGWWECDAIDQLFDHILRIDLFAKARVPDRHAIFELLRQRIVNLQSKARAGRNARVHYDLGNELFAAMLDRRMIYSCGYWKNATTLDDAQEAKLDLVCRKIGLRGGQRVLDIGCGWGGLAKFADERYGASVVGVTVSPRQVSRAREVCAGLPVEIRLQDYRDIDEPSGFDRIVSIGMFEHVGPKNYRTFMQVVHRNLKDEGLFLLHHFAGRSSFPNAHDIEVMWINKHIFPGAVIPSMKQVGAAIDGLLAMEDLHNFGTHYDPTLMAWFANFDRNWPSLREKYGDRFYRMWKYYLLSCAGAFRSGKYQLWQMVLSKNGVRGYESVR